MKIRRKYRIKYRSRPWFPFFVLLLSWVITLVSGLYIDRVADLKDQLLIDGIVSQTRLAVSRRIDVYMALLHSAVGLFTLEDSISLRQFRSFTSHLELEDNYKGIQGIGYAMRIPQEKFNEEMQYIRGQGIDYLHLRPVYDRPDYYPIIYLEPLNKRNLAAIGYDMYTEPVRRAAMKKAMDTGFPAASGKVTLVQEIDKNKQAGFLIYLPVYQNNVSLHTAAEREKYLKGFVYSPFRAGDFFSSIFNTGTDRDFDLYIYDGATSDKSKLLFSSRRTPASSVINNKAVTARIDIAGNTWSFLIIPNKYILSSFERRILPLVLATGFIVSFILFFISKLQYNARINAEKLSNEILSSQQALQQTQTRLRRLVDSNIIGVAFADKDGTVFEANDEFLRIVGYTQSDLSEGRINLMLMTPHEYKNLLMKTMRRIKLYGSHMPYEKEYLKKDGTKVPVLVGKAQADSKSNEIVALVVDLTERKKLERQKDEFISIASHELKTPVTSLKAFTQVLAKRFSKNGDNAAAAQLEKMDSQINRLTNLIKALLDVTKIEAGKLPFNMEFFNLNTLVKEVMEDIQHTTEQHEIGMQGLITKNVYADREKTGQVLTNLLSNAVKYSPNSNKINVTLHNDKDMAVVCVQDFGVGIPKQAQSKIFSRFFRVSGNQEKTFPGLGLGLYISAEIIKRLGGKIWVESEMGKGSLFCFRLPFSRQPTKRERT